MVNEGHGRTTASVEALPRFDVTTDPTPGFVLVYSRLHANLPSAMAFASDVTTIGREADNSFAIPEPAVSRYHARIEKRDDGYYLVDAGSTNGTSVGGTLVREHRLKDHDLVRIGDTLVRYAARNVFAYGPYRPDGTVIEIASTTPRRSRESLIIGGYQMAQLVEKLEKVAATSISIIVLGESGTGKELIAREAYRLSKRSGPFQAINCAALAANLIESELFGYRKGAFTGASTDKIGLVRAAHGGTLFLDEIGDMPIEAQAKLLRVLQEREVLPIGATVAEQVDVRVVCATHRDLDTLVREGKFRGDLLARLRELVAVLPPLRERREDLFALVRSFLSASGRPDAELSYGFMLAIVQHDWPYNVRELQSAVRLACALAPRDAVLDVAHLPETVRRSLSRTGNPSDADTATRPLRSATVPPTAPHFGAQRPELPPSRAGAAPSAEELVALLEKHQGNIAAVGRELGKERMQIHRWLKRHGIDLDRFRSRD